MGKRNKVKHDETQIEEDIIGLEDVEGQEIVVDASETDIEAVVAEIETNEAKAEAYAAQPVDDGEVIAEATVETTDEATEAKPKAKKAGVRSRSLSLATAKASDCIKGVLGTAPEAFFALDASDDNSEAALIARMDETLAKVDSVDKKSREKLVNVFASIAAGRLPSVYIRHTLEFLKSGATPTLKELTAHFLERKYQLGTARRQATMMFVVLPLLRIANRDAARGAPMALNPNSTLVAKFEEFANAPVEAVAEAA